MTSPEATPNNRNSEKGNGIDTSKEGIMPSRRHDAEWTQQQLADQEQSEEDSGFDCFSGPSRFSSMAAHLQSLRSNDPSAEEG